MTSKTQVKAIVASVSDTEIEVLKQLWQEQPLPASTIIERMDGDNSNNPKTVKTLINRLLKKGALRFEEKHRKYHYFPTISQEEFKRYKTHSFLNKFFGGELSPLISMFSQRGELSKKELGELKKLIEQMERDHD